MYPAPFDWHRASSFKEASDALLALGPDAKLIAGGQTLIPMMKLRLLRPTDLVDLSRVPSAAEIELVGQELRIGAMARHYAVGISAAVNPYPLLRDGALGIADPQVRNMGTIGGGLAEADPSGCWPTLLIGLDAEALCVGRNGERLVKVRDLLVDAYSPALEAGEIIAQIRIPRESLSPTSAYVAFKRSAPAYPTGSCALSIIFEDDVITSLKMGIGCAALVPYSPSGVEESVSGERLTPSLIEQIADYAAEVAEPFDDNRGSAEYKRTLVSALVKRAFSIVERRRAGPGQFKTHTYYG